MVKLYPVGIVPKKIWNTQRIEDLKAAIHRYLESDLSVPSEWYVELEELSRGS